MLCAVAFSSALWHAINRSIACQNSYYCFNTFLDRLVREMHTAQISILPAGWVHLITIVADRNAQDKSIIKKSLTMHAKKCKLVNLCVCVCVCWFWVKGESPHPQTDESGFMIPVPWVWLNIEAITSSRHFHVHLSWEDLAEFQLCRSFHGVNRQK